MFAEKLATLFHEVDGIAARQTRHNEASLSIPEFGYLSADRDPGFAPDIDKPSPTSASEILSISATLFVAALIASLITFN
jgi:hypothetical protein